MELHSKRNPDKTSLLYLFLGSGLPLGYSCADGSDCFIPFGFICNGVEDCSNGRDEENCRTNSAYSIVTIIYIIYKLYAGNLYMLMISTSWCEFKV